MFDDSGFLIGELFLLELQARDTLFVLGFELFARSKLSRSLRQCGAVDGAPHAHIWHFVRGGRAAEHARDAVVVIDSDGVKLVIVAAHTAERHAHESLADFDHLGIDVIGLHLRLVRVHDLDVAHHEEARGDDFLGVIFGGLCGHQISRDLLTHELIEGLICVESVDEVIAIAPRMLGKHGVRSAHHVGITGEIEPMPRPTFAVGFGV